jgi:hypothetical protein
MFEVAVLLLPVVLFKSASKPMAVLKKPTVLLMQIAESGDALRLSVCFVERNNALDSAV